MRRLLAVIAVLALAACAPVVRRPATTATLGAQAAREQALAGVRSWTLEGRLGVSDGHDGGSGSLTWHQDGDYYDFELRAPVTGKSFRLSGGPGGALLEGLDGGPRRGPDAQTLLRRALGWEVPLGDLRAWVLGLRAGGAPAQLRFDAEGLPSLLQQDGWSVEYRAWNTDRQPPLPAKVFATRAPYKVRLSIDTFRLGDAGAATAGAGH